MTPNRLFLAGTYNHGAPIQSVAWSCPTDTCSTPFAAIGGYKGCDSTCTCASIRAYTLDTSTSQLIPINIDNPLPTDYVYSVNWCCVPNLQYSSSFLTVAGCPDSTGHSLWAYNYVPETNSLETLGNPFVHNATLYAAKCVQLECNGRQQTYVVVAGQEADGANIKVLDHNEIMIFL